MRISRIAWALPVAIAVAGLALFLYSYAAGQKPHSVTLRWSATPCATSYNVYRGALSGGPYQKIGTASTPLYVDTQVASGAVFYYVVTVLCQNKESAYSKEMRAAIP
jgi:fibronectin type 3 domain-containing protein